MSAEVGGRLEEVAPHRSLFGPDYVRLLALLVVGAAVHGWLVAHTAIPARDSTGYARVANNLSDPGHDRPCNCKDGEPERRHRIDVIRTAEQPPGYPIAVWAVEKVLRPVTRLSLAERSLLAAQIANATAAVLLVVPLYLIGRVLFSRNVGFGAALLFEVLPVPCRMTSDGLSEGMYLLIAAVAVLLGVRFLRRPNAGGFLLCGMACGASYLVRPEGLGVALAVCAVIAWAGVVRIWPRDHVAGYLAATAVGVGLVGLPYMLLIGKISNKPTTGYLTDPLNNHPAPIWQGQPEAKARGAMAGPELFGMWWDPKRDGGKIREVWALEAVWSELSKSSHYVIGVLAAFALVAHRRQLFSPDLGLWLLLALALLSSAVMFYLAERIWYVSERHTLLFVMLSCVLASAGLKPLAELICRLPVVSRLILWPQAAPACILLSLVTSALPFTLQPLHAQREGHKHAGLYLAEHMSPGDWLIDPLSWAEWYAGRTLYENTCYHGQPSVKWVVVEEEKRDNPHSRIPQWELANTLKKEGELVYRWESPNSKAAVVCVYKVVVKPEERPMVPAPHEAPKEGRAP